MFGLFQKVRPKIKEICNDVINNYCDWEYINQDSNITSPTYRAMTFRLKKNNIIIKISYCTLLLITGTSTKRDVIIFIGRDVIDINKKEERLILKAFKKYTKLSDQDKKNDDDYKLGRVML